ncbi:MAG: phosphoribosyl-AMP cyclohydrolase [Candidatus Bathyarchaeia archaeon]
MSAQELAAHAATLADRLSYRHNGLVVAIAQDAANGQVLMTAFMNREAFKKTLETGYAHYWSTTRGKLWLKGEESGHVQRVRQVYVDCDLDAVLLKVDQEVAACHTGYRSCFYREVAPEGFRQVLPKVF